MGARTDQAREQVIAARQAFLDEAGEMRRSAGEAVNFPAKAREDPVRYGALTAGAAFVVLGGPRRLLRRVRRGVLGAPAPKTLLPREIEHAVEGMGRDGEAVRVRLEREFATYLQERRAERERSRISSLLLGAAGTAVGAFSTRAARQLVVRLMEPRVPREPGSSADEGSPPPA